MKSCIDFLNISTILERREREGVENGRKEGKGKRKKVRKKRGRVEKE